jgi:hypothetical protein
MASKDSALMRPFPFLIVLVSCVALVSALGQEDPRHEHDDVDLPPGQVVTFDPVDSILWTHIFFMSLAFGVMFPTGMVCHSPYTLPIANTPRSSVSRNHDGTSLSKLLGVFLRVTPISYMLTVSCGMVSRPRT